MFTAYLSVCRTADECKPTTHILSSDNFSELYDQIEDKGLHADYFFDNLQNSPLNNKGQWEYKTALSFDSFIWVISHSGHDENEVTEFFESLKEQRDNVASELVSPERFEELINQAGHNEMPDGEDETEMWDYMENLHGFHCAYITKN